MHNTSSRVRFRVDRGRAHAPNCMPFTARAIARAGILTERRAAVEESILLLQVPETIPNPTGLSIISLFA